MCKKTVVILIFTGVLMNSLTVCASEQHRSGKPSFTTLDANEDGQISLEEFSTRAPAKRLDPLALFNVLDSNEDGMISPQEFEERGRAGGRRH